MLKAMCYRLAPEKLRRARVDGLKRCHIFSGVWGMRRERYISHAYISRYQASNHSLSKRVTRECVLINSLIHSSAPPPLFDYIICVECYHNMPPRAVHEFSRLCLIFALYLLNIWQNKAMWIIAEWIIISFSLTSMKIVPFLRRIAKASSHVAFAMAHGVF